MNCLQLTLFPPGTLCWKDPEIFPLVKKKHSTVFYDYRCAFDLLTFIIRWTWTIFCWEESHLISLKNSYKPYLIHKLARLESQKCCHLGRWVHTGLARSPTQRHCGRRRCKCSWSSRSTRSCWLWRPSPRESGCSELGALEDPGSGSLKVKVKDMRLDLERYERLDWKDFLRVHIGNLLLLHWPSAWWQIWLFKQISKNALTIAENRRYDLPSTWYSMYLNRFHCPSQIENPSPGSGAWNIFLFLIFFLQQKMFSSQKFRLTQLKRWTQHWFRPNQIFPRPPGPSSHRGDLCYTQRLRVMWVIFQVSQQCFSLVHSDGTSWSQTQ